MGLKSVVGLKLVVVAGILAAILCVPGTAVAAGRPGTTYVLDINRQGSGGQIIAVSATGSTRTIPTPHGPGVEPTMKQPVGLTVDAQGFLIVAVSDGYNSTYRFLDRPTEYSCGPGCGAILRVNPDDGSAVVLSKGPGFTNPESVLLPPDGNITDGKNDYLIVADTGDWNIITVNLSQPLGSNPDGGQSYFFDNRNFLPPNSSKAGCEAGQGCMGLRRPRDIAYDPRNNDVLVLNAGAYPESFGPGLAVAPALTGVRGCDDDPSAPGFSERDGYIVRLHPGRAPVYYCDDDLVAPRGIVAGKNGTAYITDPFSVSGTSFAGVFQLTGGQIEPLSGGGNLALPSGISTDYSGKRLLVADETSAASAAGVECSADSICGGLIRVNPDGGAQATVLHGSTSYRNPIDVAVDRRGARQVLPPKRRPRRKRGQRRRPPIVNTLSFFGRDGRSVSYDSSGGISRFPVWGLRRGARVRIECISRDCPRRGTPKQRFANDTEVVFNFSGSPLQGTFRVVTFVPLPRHRRASSRSVVRNTAAVRWQGRYRVLRFANGRFSIPAEGCLKPGARIPVKARKHRTIAKCPAG